MIVDNERSFARDSPVCWYWLTRSEGFTVRAGRHVLGVVEQVQCDHSLGEAESLLVRSGYRRRLVDAEQVVGVVPARELLLAEPRQAAPGLRHLAVAGGRRGGRH